MLNPVQRAAVRHLVAYDFSPPEARMTHESWCEVVGISVRTLQNWMKGNEEFRVAVRSAKEEAEETADPFALYARQWALEQMFGLYAKAKTTTEKRQLLKEVMEQTKHVDAGEVVDYSHLTDDDLLSLCLARSVSPIGMTQDQLKRLAEGDADD